MYRASTRRVGLVRRATAAPRPGVRSIRGGLGYLFGGAFGARKAIAALAVSPPLALPALITQFLPFDTVVPQVPLPTLPVTTLNLVGGNTPLAVTVAGVAVAMSHWP